MLRRRRNAFPRPGDRVSLAAPLPATAGGHGAERSGTVLERSTGRSGALLVRWDAGSNRSGVATETWLSDAVWQWEHGNLRVIDGKAAPVHAPEQRRGPILEGEDTWLAAYPRQRDDAGEAGTRTAVDDWEAAMRSEVDPAEDDGWEAALAAALGIAAPPGAPPAVPAPPASPAPPARFAPTGHAASPERAPAEGPAPAHTAFAGDELVAVSAAPHAVQSRPAPAPERAAEPERTAPAPAAEARPGSRAPWIGDDILPNRRKGGRSR